MGDHRRQAGDRDQHRDRVQPHPAPRRAAAVQRQLARGAAARLDTLLQELKANYAPLDPERHTRGALPSRPVAVRERLVRGCSVGCGAAVTMGKLDMLLQEPRRATRLWSSSATPAVCCRAASMLSTGYMLLQSRVSGRLTGLCLVHFRQGKTAAHLTTLLAQLQERCMPVDSGRHACGLLRNWVAGELNVQGCYSR